MPLNKLNQIYSLKHNTYNFTYVWFHINFNQQFFIFQSSDEESDSCCQASSVEPAFSSSESQNPLNNRLVSKFLWQFFCDN